MKILALETSAQACSAAVIEGGEVVCQTYQSTGLTHSRTLMAMVESMLQNAGLAPADCGAVAVANGPGSFTGIRIGVAAAKGLAFALDVPAAGVSTLEAMARNLSGMEGTVVCAMDARRAQVYNALFTAGGGAVTRRTPDRAIALADLAAELADIPGPKFVLGDGAELCHAALTERGVACTLAPPQLLRQSAVSVGLCAGDILRAGGGQTAQALSPVYLRPPSAKTLRERTGNTDQNMKEQKV